MDMQHAPKPATFKTHLDAIDALRGIAILGVVAVHTGQHFTSGIRVLDNLLHVGARGVELFYIVSAFTLFLSMARKFHTEARPVLSYAVRRLCRIAPLFWLAILFYGLKDGFAPRFWAPEGLTIWHFVSTSFFVHGFFPTHINSVVPGGWSVADEMLFYTLVPFLFVHITTARRATLAVILSILIAFVAKQAALAFLAWRGITPDDITSLFLDLWLPAHLLSFSLGMLLYHVWQRPSRAARPAMALGLLTLSILGLFLSSRGAPLLPFLSNDQIFALMLGLFAYSVLAHPIWPIVNPATRAVGRYSFGMYLSHFALLPVAQMILQPLQPGPLQLLAALGVMVVLSYLVSWALHVWVEQPGINLGKRWVARLNPRSPSP